MLHTPAGERAVALPMPGRFNVANALAALAVVHALGGDLDVLVSALERGVRVPGRFEPVDEGQDFAVLVDYAHTPDSLENVLNSARELTPSGERSRERVVCVFGAGGDRDAGKRPLMGEVAAHLADAVIVTSDNPRSEDPDQIIAEIMTGVAGVRDGRAAVRSDRRSSAGDRGGHRVCSSRATSWLSQARDTSRARSSLTVARRPSTMRRSPGRRCARASTGHRSGIDQDNGVPGSPERRSGAAA